MSATTAAQAMLDHDSTLACLVAALDDVPTGDHAVRTSVVLACLRLAAGLPSLTFAADASATSKRQILEALVCHPRFQVDGQPLSRQVVSEIFTS